MIKGSKLNKKLRQQENQQAVEHWFNTFPHLNKLSSEFVSGEKSY